MAKLDRILQKIFGATGGNSEFAEIGSLAAGDPEYTKDLDTIQSLSQFAGGLFDITDSCSEPPRIQDINALYLLITSQLKYLFQAGIPEWIITEDFYAGSFCQIAGNMYRSLTGTINSPNTGNDPATDTINWQDVDAFFRNAGNLNAGTIPLAQIPATLTGKTAAACSGNAATASISNKVRGYVYGQTAPAGYYIIILYGPYTISISYQISQAVPVNEFWLPIYY